MVMLRVACNLCVCLCVWCLLPSWVTALTVVETDVGMVLYAGDSIGGLSVWTKVAPAAEGEEGALAGVAASSSTAPGGLMPTASGMLPAPLSHSIGSLAAYSHVRVVPGKAKVCLCVFAQRARTRRPVCFGWFACTATYTLVSL